MSKRFFADTNLFIRLFVNDDPIQTEAVLNLLKSAEQHNIQLVINVTVVAEVVWVLSSVFKLEPPQIREHVWAILNHPGIEVSESSLIAQAIDAYVAKNIDFIDAYNAYWIKANQIEAVYTFDRRHFSRIDGLNVQVPQSLKLN
jgi:predicted nucleic-acid-binding protein